MFRTKTNAKIYIGLGSNLGDRAGNLLLAVRGLLNAGLEVVRLSAIYETEPLTETPQPTFLNMVVEIKGSSAPPADQLLARMLKIEYALGRNQRVRNGPRTIDLDLLLYKDEVHQTDFLTLPHPRMHERKFVLVPLCEIAPNAPHPTLHKTITELLRQTNDRSAVDRWQP